MGPRPMRVIVSPARDVRHALNVEGDVAGDVAFQNDVNALLDALSRLAAPAAERTPRRLRGPRGPGSTGRVG